MLTSHIIIKGYIIFLDWLFALNSMYWVCCSNIEGGITSWCGLDWFYVFIIIYRHLLYEETILHTSNLKPLCRLLSNHLTLVICVVLSRSKLKSNQTRWLFWGHFRPLWKWVAIGSGWKLAWVKNKICFSKSLVHKVAWSPWDSLRLGRNVI